MKTMPPVSPSFIDSYFQPIAVSGQPTAEMSGNSSLREDLPPQSSEAERVSLAEATQPASLADTVYHYLWEKIATLELKPGTKLSEAGLARKFNCSRIPVREAVKRLKDQGALDVFPQRGSFVSLIDLRQVEQVRYLREVLETHVVLEDYDRGLLDTLLPVLDAMIRRQEESIRFNRLEEITTLDQDFHDIFYHVGQREFVQYHTGRYDIHYIRARRFALGIERSDKDSADDSRNIVLQHVDIVDAIRRHDRDRLAGDLVNHFRNINRTLREGIEEDEFDTIFTNRE